MKVAANKCTKIMHSTGALSVDFDKYDTQLNIFHEVEVT